MSRYTSPSLSLAALLLASCYTGRVTPQPAVMAAHRPKHPHPTDAQQVAELCPLRVPQSVVIVEPVERGVALVFTTTGDVSDVRRRTRAMADLHDFNRDLIARAVRTKRSIHAAFRYVEDVDGGARIVFRPPHATDLFQYREEVNFEAMRLRAGDCPMIMPDRAEPESETIATASR